MQFSFRRFIPEAAGSYARADFKNSKQEPNESVLQWHSRLRDVFLTVKSSANSGSMCIILYYLTRHTLTALLQWEMTMI